MGWFTRNYNALPNNNNNDDNTKQQEDLSRG